MKNSNMKQFKLMVVSLLAIGLLVFLSGCNNSVQGEIAKNGTVSNVVDTESVQQTIKELHQSKTITLKKGMFTLNSKHTITTDNGLNLSLQGNYINMTGDVFTITNEEGHVISKEKQIKRWNVKLNRMAEVYDYQGNTIGYIGEEVIKDMFKLGYKFHFYDASGTEIGYTKQKVLSVVLNNTIYNNDGSEAYTLKNKFWALTDHTEITVKDNSTINPEQAIMFAAIINAIHQAESEEED